MATKRTESIDVFGATLTRRQFVKTSGILAVGISVVGAASLRGDTKAAVAKNSLDPTLASSWLEIHPDSTVTIRTGRTILGRARSTRLIGRSWLKNCRCPSKPSLRS